MGFEIAADVWGNKVKSQKTIRNAQAEKSVGTGYGGHFRSVQGYKYLGIK